MLRTLRFSGFLLTEYVRSGRILVELLAGVVFFYLLMRRWGLPMDPEQHFSLLGVGSLLLTAYTGFAMLRLGDRPQGYLLLVRRLGRSGYLFGIYFATLAVVLTVYLLLTVAARLHNWPFELGWREWALGALPLVLNVALLAAMLLPLSTLVLSNGWRLVVLLFIALAFSGNVIGGPQLQALPTQLQALLNAVRAVLAFPLLPVFTGFELSVSREYVGSQSLATLIAQASLTLFILIISSFAFRRRELILSPS